MQKSEKAKQQLLSTLLQVLSLTPIELDLVVSVPPTPKGLLISAFSGLPVGSHPTREARDHLRLLRGIHREHMIAHNQSRLCFRFMLTQNHEACPLPPGALSSRSCETVGHVEGGNTLQSLTKILPSPSI